ncbi:MAG: hypothetical protein JJE28_00020 [Actinomycetales bacterium]|nr:hypothetical protein [Actinomycetales bacterium]
MAVGTVFIWAFLFLCVGFLVWFCIGLLKFFVRAVTYTARPSSTTKYPDGADEPDGSSYSEVRGEVRLD